jgi:hypothetical protein
VNEPCHIPESPADPDCIMGPAQAVTSMTKTTPMKNEVAWRDIM